MTNASAATASNGNRSVARPVANLGNTCYMNAVLQALVHAPELCNAMDCEPHSTTCPIATANILKAQATASPESSPEDNTAVAAVSMSAAIPRKSGTRRSKRSSSGRNTPQDGEGDNANDEEFCALCEVEQHFHDVHDPNHSRDSPVAPSKFVHGFIQHVAPWFKLGVQEDSHEFLRLLIDAMQKSCEQARKGGAALKQEENPQDDASPKANPSVSDDEEEDTSSVDKEYPFSLFRGTVESNVVCEHCKASSSTLDPIEDIGLEVTMPGTTVPTKISSSRSSSPLNAPVLVDVTTALQRFARAEALDAGYKCETCGRTGRATKQSRLASIPPILTLHLKRFRYGEARLAPDRRAARSEVSQLLGNGSTGSAKIEGHVPFPEVFSLKEYLTDELKTELKGNGMFCRLFAVVVHAGKNSHSGHYVSYVRSLTNTGDWWKMDDGRVTLASFEQEVKHAEAYMLFYRVMGHPVSTELAEKKKHQDELQEVSVKLEAPTHSVEPSRPFTRLSSRKRPKPEFANGSEWGRSSKTNFPPHLQRCVKQVEDFITDEIQLTAECFDDLSKDAAKDNACIGKGPASNVSEEEDIVGGVEGFQTRLKNLFYRLIGQTVPENNGVSCLAPAANNVKDSPAKSSRTLIPVVEADDEDML